MTDLFEGVKVLAKKYKCYQFMWDPCFEEGDDKCTKLIEDMGFKHIHKAAELTTIQARNNYREITASQPQLSFTFGHLRDCMKLPYLLVLANCSYSARSFSSDLLIISIL